MNGIFRPTTSYPSIRFLKYKFPLTKFHKKYIIILIGSFLRSIIIARQATPVSTAAMQCAVKHYFHKSSSDIQRPHGFLLLPMRSYFFLYEKKKVSKKAGNARLLSLSFLK